MSHNSVVEGKFASKIRTTHELKLRQPALRKSKP